MLPSNLSEGFEPSTFRLTRLRDLVAPRNASVCLFEQVHNHPCCFHVLVAEKQLQLARSGVQSPYALRNGSGLMFKSGF
jgi:hypothetical protein